VKKIAIIPTLCTLGNGCCGFAAIYFASRVTVAHPNNPAAADFAAYLSGWLIFAAMVFDVLDGYLARLSRTASQFGAELDSLCDAISFGVAPGFLLIQMASGFQDRRLLWDIVLVIAALYMICAILRLARFNVQTTLDVKSHKTFRGLPSPAAAGCVAALALVRYDFPTRDWLTPEHIVTPLILWAAPPLTLLVAVLMVSRVPYPHLVNQLLHRRRSFSRLVQLIPLGVALYLFRELAVLVGFWCYALAGPVMLLWNRAWRREPVQEPVY
jgi:CDP-diacylglycerol--serine O-phosphatidyltransferase